MFFLVSLSLTHSLSTNTFCHELSPAACPPAHPREIKGCMYSSGDEGGNSPNGNGPSQEVEHENAPSKRIGFSCQMDSTKAILSTITGIHNGKKDHHVIVRVFDGSITFLTHDKGQNMQGQATILRDSFSFYEQYSGDKRNVVKVNLKKMQSSLK